MSIYQYLFECENKSNYSECDKNISSRLDSKTLLYAYYHIKNKSYLIKHLPETVLKINSVILEDDNLKKSSLIVKALLPWLSDDTILNVVQSSITDEEFLRFYNCAYDVVNKAFDLKPEMINTALNTSIGIYSKHPKLDYLEGIKFMFQSAPLSELDNMCKILCSGTPTVASCLLSRSDISDEYILVGLKSLSKLSKQKSISVKINIEMLKKLGPKSRLDAIKQLLGLMKYGGRTTPSMPFDPIPSKDQLRDFLFPCSIKYNSEVSDVMSKFSEILNQFKLGGDQ